MISIIIPTLWKADEIYDTISNFQKYNNIEAELIIINNSQKQIEFENINIITPYTNVGVNPAWNMGVNASRYEMVLLLNDDITLDFSLFFKFIKDLPNNLDFGAIVGDWRYISGDDKNNPSDVLTLKENNLGRFFGYGCFQIMLKKYYYNIPLELKYFFGDDLLYFIVNDMLNLPIYYINNLKLQGRMSVSSKNIVDDFEYEKFQSLVIKLRKFYSLRNEEPFF